MASTLLEASARHPNDNRDLLLDRPLRRPDVEIQAILALGVPIQILGQELPVEAGLVAAVLVADGLVGLRVGGAVVGRLLRRHEP